MAKSRKKRVSSTIWLRRGVQAAFAGFILISAALHFTNQGQYPSVDALCPFGLVEMAWTWFTTGQFLPKTAISNVVLGTAVFLGTFVVGGAFCGWMCPLGALQQMLTWLQKKLRLPQIYVPERWDKRLTYGRFVVLALIITMSAVTATLWFADYDPYRTIFSLHWLFDFSPTAWLTYTLAGAVMGAALFIPRFWCRYLCPMGGMLGVIQYLSPIKIRRDAQVCIDCNLCNKACPMKLEVATVPAVSGDCIACLECIERCPKPGALNVSWGQLIPLEEKSHEIA